MSLLVVFDLAATNISISTNGYFKSPRDDRLTDHSHPIEFPEVKCRHPRPKAHPPGRPYMMAVSSKNLRQTQRYLVGYSTGVFLSVLATYLFSLQLTSTRICFLLDPGTQKLYADDTRLFLAGFGSCWSVPPATTVVATVHGAGDGETVVQRVVRKVRTCRRHFDAALTPTPLRHKPATNRSALDLFGDDTRFLALALPTRNHLPPLLLGHLLRRTALVTQ